MVRTTMTNSQMEALTALIQDEVQFAVFAAVSRGELNSGNAAATTNFTQRYEQLVRSRQSFVRAFAEKD